MNATILLCVILLACIGHGFFWVGLVNRIHAWAGRRWIIDFTTMLCVLAFAGIPLAIAIAAWNGQEGLRSETPGFGTFGMNRLSAVYLDFLALGGGAMLLYRLLGPRHADRPGTLLDCRKEWIDVEKRTGTSPLVGPSARMLNLVPGNQVLKISVEKKRLAIPRLNAAHVGLSIAHISDLHMTGRVGCEFFQFAAEQIAALQPDIIALTGDILENSACRPWLAKSLGPLHAEFGKYFILGNHDQFVDFEQTRTMLTELGWTCVSGRCVSAEWNGQPAIVAGNELPWFAPADLSNVPARQPAGQGAASAPFRLVLSHSPDQFAWACRHDADLVLTGHTHGGQICFPLLGPVACPSRFGTRYVGGVYRTGSTIMHVTRGLSGETPLRWNCPPEIALLELAKA